MTDPQYVMADSDAGDERARLIKLEEMNDAATLRRVDAIGVDAGSDPTSTKPSRTSRVRFAQESGCCARSQTTDRWKRAIATTRVTRELIMASGFFTEESFERMLAMFGDPSFAYIDNTWIGAWGQVPN